MILSASNFIFKATPLTDWGAILQQIAGVKFRRAGRFSHAVLSGALECVKNRKDNDFCVYFGTAYGDVESTIKSHDNIFLQNFFPMPFSFINTLSNTPLFFLLQHLNFNSSALSVSHSAFAFESALALALCDLRQKRAKRALVGVCDVWYEPLDKAFELIDKELCEFSSWLLIEESGGDFVKFFNTFDELAREIENLNPKNPLFVSCDFDADEIAKLQKICAVQNHQTPKTIASQAAAIVCSHFARSKEPLLYAGRDRRGGFSLIGIS